MNLCESAEIEYLFVKNFVIDNNDWSDQTDWIALARRAQTGPQIAISKECCAKRIRCGANAEYFHEIVIWLAPKGPTDIDNSAVCRLGRGTAFDYTNFFFFCFFIMCFCWWGGIEHAMTKEKNKQMTHGKRILVKRFVEGFNFEIRLCKIWMEWFFLMDLSEKGL